MRQEDRFTSGFAYNEDGSMMFLVNTKYYKQQDDRICFILSSGFHGLKNIKIETEYKIMRADIKYINNNSWDVNIEWKDDGKNELRIYKVVNE